MHPFWSSHEEKRDCVRLSMGGGHGQSWSSMGAHGKIVGEGQGACLGGGGLQGGAIEVAARSSWLPLCAVCYVLCEGRRKEKKEEERGGKRKGRKRRKEKNMENFPNLKISKNKR
jgi:hypothetical protein